MFASNSMLVLGTRFENLYGPDPTGIGPKTVLTDLVEVVLWPDADPGERDFQRPLGSLRLVDHRVVVVAVIDSLFFRMYGDHGLVESFEPKR